MTNKDSRGAVEITINGNKRALPARPQRVAWIARCLRCRRWFYAAFVEDNDETREQMTSAKALDPKAVAKVSTQEGHRIVLTEPMCECRKRHLRKVEDGE